jgi:hypothetical protein
MKIALTALLALGSLPAATADTDIEPSPYAGMAGREIKALSEAEIEGYLAGKGMGLALPAELNGYPGPKHVLELGEAMGLTVEQERLTQASFDKMHGRAVQLGRRLVDGERALDVLFRSGTVDADRLREQVGANAVVLAELRAAHLEAHLDMTRILTRDQVGRYAALRGYHKPAGDHSTPGGPGCPHADP